MRFTPASRAVAAAAPTDRPTRSTTLRADRHRACSVRQPGGGALCLGLRDLAPRGGPWDAARCAASREHGKLNSPSHSGSRRGATATTATARVRDEILGVGHRSPHPLHSADSPRLFSPLSLSLSLGLSLSSPPFSLDLFLSPPSQVPLFSDRGNRGTLIRKQTLLFCF